MQQIFKPNAVSSDECHNLDAASQVSAASSNREKVLNDLFQDLSAEMTIYQDLLAQLETFMVQEGTACDEQL